MNTANLQLEGLYIAFASILNTLVEKGLLSREEINVAMQRAEQTVVGDIRVTEDLSPANRDAISLSGKANRIGQQHGLRGRSAALFGTCENGGRDQRVLQRSALIPRSRLKTRSTDQPFRFLRECATAQA
jgi:hypothetical protein